MSMAENILSFFWFISQGHHIGAAIAGGALGAAAGYGVSHVAHNHGHSGHGSKPGYGHGKFKHGKHKFKKWK